MKTNNIYKTEINAARALFKWMDKHPYLTNVIWATEALIFAYFAFIK